MNCGISGCQIDHESHPCATPGCGRAVLRSSGGTYSKWCETCARFYLTRAFAPQSWHDKAKAHQLPGMIVGGIAA